MRFGVLGFSPMFNRGVLQSGPAPVTAPVILSAQVGSDGISVEFTGDKAWSESSLINTEFSFIISDKIVVGVYRKPNVPTVFVVTVDTVFGPTDTPECSYDGSAGIASTDGGVLAEFTITATNASTFISHLQGAIASDANGYYWPTISGSNHARFVQSYATQFNANNSYVDTTTRLTYTANKVNKWRITGSIDDLTLAASTGALVNGQKPSKNIILKGGTDEGGVIIHTELAKLVVHMGNNWGNHARFVPDFNLTTDPHTYDVEVDYHVGYTVKFYIDGILQQTMSIPAPMRGNTLANTTSSVGGNGLCGRFSAYRVQKFEDGTLVFDMPFQHNSINSTTKSWDVVSGNGYSIFNVSTVQTNDLYPGNLLNGYTVYTKDSDGTTVFIPYKLSGGSLVANEPTINGYTKGTNYPAVNGHNFGETKLQLVSGTIITVHDLCNISNEKYFINPSGTYGVTEAICYSAVQNQSQISAILNYIGVDESGWYGIEWDETVTNNPAVTAIYQEGFEKLLYALPVNRGMLSGLIKDGAVNYYLDPHDHTKKWDGADSDLSGADGNKMVRIPAHYEKFEQSGNTQRVKFSLNSFTGATLIPEMWVSGYNASMDWTDNTLASVKSDAARYRGGDHGNPSTYNWRVDLSAWDAEPRTMLRKPTTQWKLSELRTLARNIGSGWEVEYYQPHKTMDWLMAIEYCTRDLQKPVATKFNGLGVNQGGLGRGVTNFTSIVPVNQMWKDIEAFFGSSGRVLPFAPIGESDSLGNFSGEVIFDIPGFATRTGTITCATNSAAVVGVGTHFSDELLVDAALYTSDRVLIGYVSSITDNTHLTLKDNAAVTLSGQSYRGLGWLNINRYRGIELPGWGDILYQLDGVNIKHEHDATHHTITAYIFDDPTQFKDASSEGASRSWSGLPYPESQDFAPIKSIMFGDHGDIIAKTIDGIGGNKENPTAFADRYHPGNGTTIQVDGVWVLTDDGWWINCVGNDIYACGDLAKSAGPFFHWAHPYDHGHSGSQQNYGCKIVFIPSFQ